MHIIQAINQYIGSAYRSRTWILMNTLNGRNRAQRVQIRLQNQANEYNRWGKYQLLLESDLRNHRLVETHDIDLFLESHQMYW